MLKPYYPTISHRHILHFTLKVFFSCRLRALLITSKTHSTAQRSSLSLWSHSPIYITSPRFCKAHTQHLKHLLWAYKYKEVQAKNLVRVYMIKLVLSLALILHNDIWLLSRKAFELPCFLYLEEFPLDSIKPNGWTDRETKRGDIPILLWNYSRI